MVRLSSRVKLVIGIVLSILMLSTISCVQQKDTSIQQAKQPAEQLPEISPSIQQPGKLAGVNDRLPEIFPNIEEEFEYFPIIYHYEEFLNTLDYKSLNANFIGAQKEIFDGIFSSGEDSWLNTIIDAQVVDYFVLPTDVFDQIKLKGIDPVHYEIEKGIILKLNYNLSEEKYFSRSGINYELIQLVQIDDAWLIERIGAVSWATIQNYYIVPFDAK